MVEVEPLLTLLYKLYFSQRQESHFIDHKTICINCTFTEISGGLAAILRLFTNIITADAGEYRRRLTKWSQTRLDPHSLTFLSIREELLIQVYTTRSLNGRLFEHHHSIVI